jgi:hypothetical protein
MIVSLGLVLVYFQIRISCLVKCLLLHETMKDTYVKFQMLCRQPVYHMFSWRMM